MSFVDFPGQKPDETCVFQQSITSLVASRFGVGITDISLSVDEQGKKIMQRWQVHSLNSRGESAEEGDEEIAAIWGLCSRVDNNLPMVIISLFSTITPDMLPYPLVRCIIRGLLVYRWIFPVVEDPILSDRTHLNADPAG